MDEPRTVITTDFLKLLLEQVYEVFMNQTLACAELEALQIAMSVTGADGNPVDNSTAELILDDMALLANGMLRGELTPATRERLEKIKQVSPFLFEEAA